MYSFTYFSSVLFTFILALVGFAATAPLYLNIINIAEGGPLNNGDPILILLNTVKEF
jgi:hypothetical protein